MKAWLRLTLAAMTAALVWLIAAPAEAAAPRCDPRGAITFAPPPTLEEPNRSVDVAPPDFECLSALFGTPALGRGVERGRTPAPSVDAVSFDVMPAHGRALLRAPADAAPDFIAEHARALREHKMTLERPPRA